MASAIAARRSGSSRPAGRAQRKAGAAFTAPAPSVLDSGGFARAFVLGRFGLRLRLDGAGAAGIDLDLARLHRVRNLADEGDGEQAVLHLGALDPDEVGKLEAALQRAG